MNLGEILGILLCLGFIARIVSLLKKISKKDIEIATLKMIIDHHVRDREFLILKGKEDENVIRERKNV